MGDTDILVALAAHGLSFTWEYPGMVKMHIDDTHAVYFGLSGWEYGSRSVLTDGGWEPDEDNTAEPDGLTEGVTDPEVIATAWAAWLAQERQAKPCQMQVIVAGVGMHDCPDNGTERGDDGGLYCPRHAALVRDQPDDAPAREAHNLTAWDCAEAWDGPTYRDQTCRHPDCAP